MPKRSSKKPSRQGPEDVNTMAARILATAIGEGPALGSHEKDPAAVSLGRRGGLKGGKARAAALTKKQRVEAAKLAASARWKKS